MRKANDLTGRKFGYLTAIELSSSRAMSGNAMWKCRCDCGKEKVFRADRLTNGKASSCGCMTRAIKSVKLTTHGATGNRTYRIWAAMKQRCLNPKNKDFADYGGRGIQICQRWADSFENFVADMGNAPEALSIDRYPDPNGNYEPGNCRWTTMKEQNRNRRYHVLVTHEGRTQCVSAWAEEFKVNEPMLRIYLKKKMSLGDAVAALRGRVTRFSNGRNKENSSGYPGVKKSLNKWIARIVVNGERRHLGTFDTAELAYEAYRSFKHPANKPAEV